jgi:hypothetical protein
MLDHKLLTRRRLKVFNDESIPDGSTLDSLKSRRMSIARQIFGRLGSDTNIEQSLFCTGAAIPSSVMTVI